MNQRERLKRRIGAYRGKWLVYMFESDFQAIFRKIQNEIGLKEYDIQEIVKRASDEQINQLHYKLDEYQIMKRLE